MKERGKVRKRKGEAEKKKHQRNSAENKGTREYVCRGCLMNKTLDNDPNKKAYFWLVAFSCTVFLSMGLVSWRSSVILMFGGASIFIHFFSALLLPVNDSTVSRLLHRLRVPPWSWIYSLFLFLRVLVNDVASVSKRSLRNGKSCKHKEGPRRAHLHLHIWNGSPRLIFTCLLFTSKICSRMPTWNCVFFFFFLIRCFLIH